jgi:hypothetical protein
MVRARQYPECAVVRVGWGEIAKNGHLRGGAPVAHGVIPAPPVLVPPQSPAAGIFDADVSGNPFDIVGIYAFGENVEATSRGQKELNDAMIPSQRQEGIVRARASAIGRRAEERLNRRASFRDFTLIQNPSSTIKPSRIKALGC